ncbi:MAG: hypothetical protein IRY99_04665, partial [Isosphaeraceae bacterium]|nr:hypothetical protein [Isosphaeraceae bacterium]
MTKPEADESIQDPATAPPPAADGEATETTETPEPEPQPEPWTPERVLEWNRYYDLYVAAGVLGLVFAVAAHKIVSSGIWPLLQAGRLSVRTMGPVLKDPFSFSQFGQIWVNISWLFEWVNALIYDLARGPVGRAASAARREQIAAGVLVGINATVRMLTALVLLTIRRPGPGLWWAAICAGLALGGIVQPALQAGGHSIALSLGGLAGLPEVDPATWGLLLLAVELALIHQAAHLGRPRAALALPLVFGLWANVHDSFFVGLLLLAAAVLGTLARPARGEPVNPAWNFPRGLAILGACLVACLVNPSTYRVYPAVIQPLLDLTRPGELLADQLSIFGPESQKYYDTIVPHAHRMLIAYYLLTVSLGLASFALNRRRFALGRFLVFAVAAVLWAIRQNFGPEFALVWAVVLALNGQEWYLDQFGAEGRMGRGWTAWSVGGRLVTLGVVMLFLFKSLTGYGNTSDDPPPGFGFVAQVFPFEVADYLKAAPIRGNVLNFRLDQGDALIWRAWPANHDRRTYIDSRRHLFGAEVRQQLRDLKRALREEAPDQWRPILDDLKVSAVMIDFTRDRPLYDAMARSPHWIEFYDDGATILFGRAEVPADLAEDVTYFREHMLDAEALVYQRPQEVPSATQPPTPTSALDTVFRYRAQIPLQPHVQAAIRWLSLRPGPD